MFGWAEELLNLGIFGTIGRQKFEINNFKLPLLMLMSDFSHLTTI
jgi:hypothetical protein